MADAAVTAAAKTKTTTKRSKTKTEIASYYLSHGTNGTKGSSSTGTTGSNKPPPPPPTIAPPHPPVALRNELKKKACALRCLVSVAELYVKDTPSPSAAKFIRRELAKLESFNSNMVSAISSSSSVDDLSFNEGTSGVSNLSSDGTPPISMLPSSACSSFSSDVGEDLHVIREVLMESEGTTMTDNGEEDAEEETERETDNPSRPSLQPRQYPEEQQRRRRQRQSSESSQPSQPSKEESELAKRVAELEALVRHQQLQHQQLQHQQQQQHAHQQHQHQREGGRATDEREARSPRVDKPAHMFDGGLAEATFGVLISLDPQRFEDTFGPRARCPSSICARHSGAGPAV